MGRPERTAAIQHRRRRQASNTAAAAISDARAEGSGTIAMICGR
jgi:hypothetical protein